MSRSLLVTAIAIALLPATSAGQGIELTREGRSGVAIEALRPNVDGGGTSVLSGAFYLSGHAQLGGAARLVAELPIAHASIDGEFDEGNSTLIGNPYIALQWASARTTFEVGLRAPLAETFDGATGVGMLADVMRLEAFAPELMSIRASLQVAAPLSQGISANFQVVPIVWVPTGENDVDKELVVGYAAGLGYRATSLRLNARIAGRALVTAEEEDDDRTFHQFGMSADFGSGRVRPGVYAAVPIDDTFGEAVNSVLGLTIQITTK